MELLQASGSFNPMMMGMGGMPGMGGMGGPPMGGPGMGGMGGPQYPGLGGYFWDGCMHIIYLF